MRDAVDEYLLYVGARRAQATVDKARLVLTRFVEYLQARGVSTLAQLTRDDWLGFIAAARERGLGAWSVRNYARLTSQFLRWCYAEGLVDECVVRAGDVPRPPEPQPRPLTVDAVRALLARCRGAHWLDARDHALILTLLETGLRRAELCAMTVAHARTGVVVAPAKGGRTARAYLSPKCRDAILRYLRAYRRQTGRALGDDDALWRARTGEPLTPNGLMRALHRRSAGLPERIAPHRLRATSITWRLGLGASTELVREAVGHRDESSLRHYAKMAQSDIESLLTATSPLQRLEE